MGKALKTCSCNYRKWRFCGASPETEGLNVNAFSSEVFCITDGSCCMWTHFKTLPKWRCFTHCAAYPRGIYKHKLLWLMKQLSTCSPPLPGWKHENTRADLSCFHFVLTPNETSNVSWKSFWAKTVNRVIKFKKTVVEESLAASRYFYFRHHHLLNFKNSISEDILDIYLTFFINKVTSELFPQHFSNFYY